MSSSKPGSLRYATTWFMLHRLRAALFEREGFELESFVEADETFYGGYRKKGRKGRSKNVKKAQIVLAVEKRLAEKGHASGLPETSASRSSTAPMLRR